MPSGVLVGTSEHALKLPGGRSSRASTRRGPTAGGRSGPGIIGGVRRALLVLLFLAMPLGVMVARAPGATAPESGPPTGQTGAAERPGAPVVEEVQRVLDARVAALGARDREAFLATIDPLAGPLFREAQARSFDGWASLPLSSYALAVRLDDSGDLAPGADLGRRYGGVPAFLPETRQTYRLSGYDERDAVDTLWLTYVQRAGRWYVAADDDLTALGLDSARNLWDLGPVRLQPTPHFLVVSRPDRAERADALAGIAEEASGVLAERWDRPWSQRIPLVLPSSPDELEVLLQSSFDLDKFVAFVAYAAVRDDGWEATAPRIYVQDANLSAASRASQVRTLVHELSHAAAAPLAGPAVPAWVHEGVADWVAGGRRTDERPPAGSDGRLPEDHEFTTGSQGDVVGSYAESRSAVSRLAADEGTDAPGAFLEALGADRIGAGSTDWRVDAALRAVAGTGVSDLEEAWASG